ncbi:MAG: hypothetical protein JWR10_3316 [Rubritepida sp.]|nr:hypothetical protein [Rubritepida sp.]
MLRNTALSALILAASAVALPARAQMASYCSGSLQAITFNTQVVPGPGGRATYSVLLRNAGGQASRFQIVVTAPFLGRPASNPRAIAPGATANIGLGYQVNQPGQHSLRANELAEVVRITCV